MNKILLIQHTLLRQIKHIKIIFLSLLLCTGLLVGCGSSGDGGGKNENGLKGAEGTEENLPAIESTEGLNWDKTDWDQDEWG